MKARQIYLIIGLMSLSLIGIITLQVQQIRRSLAIQEANFQTSAQNVLDQVADELQRSEVETRMVKVSRAYEVMERYGTEVPTGLQLGSPEMPSFPSLRRIRIRDSLSIITEQDAFIDIQDTTLWQRLQTSMVQSEEGQAGVLQMKGDPRIMELINQTISGLSNSSLPIYQRLDSLLVDSMLRREVKEQALPEDFNYMVKAERESEAALLSPGADASVLVQSRYQTRLFPYLNNLARTNLYLQFPEQGLYIFQAIWVQALVSFLFSAIVVLAFWLSIRTILRQKRLSEMKNDFINNMTHELKTPIATISLATDALQNPRIQAETSSIDRYAGIIKEENQRMHRQVERVLQAARFSRKEVKLKPETVDIHQLIESAANSLRLQLQEREGKLELHLNADPSSVQGDPEHLSNVIFNLLDNANKYSQDQPLIEVRTRKQGQSLVIEVKDQGVGINKQDQQQIFNRFFRVSTGNLHDVKGFGLGLSYVKEIIEAHNGEVSVSSQIGKGSTFRVKLPYEV
ncbi:MAG: HAMP domain-containing sensor histidine kinase [Bacteroidota bacterium]